MQNPAIIDMRYREYKSGEYPYEQTMYVLTKGDAEAKIIVYASTHPRCWVFTRIPSDRLSPENIQEAIDILTCTKELISKIGLIPIGHTELEGVVNFFIRG